MKGIILAGGHGTRLAPLTPTINKHLLPVYDKPMIYYAMMPLMLADIKDILIITNPQDLFLFKKLLGTGQQWGINLSYQEQKTPKGLADAFIVGEEFIGSDSVSLILGDNIFYGHSLGTQLIECTKLTQGGIVFAYEVKDPERYGVVTFNESNEVVAIEEKPKKAQSPYAVTGLYFYDNQVIDFAKSLKPSSRGELEITDINNIYLEKNQLQVEVLNRGVSWLDAGTPASLLDAANFIHIIQERQGLSVACLEEIALKKGYIEISQFEKLALQQKNSDYGRYLLKLLKKTEQQVEVLNHA